MLLQCQKGQHVSSDFDNQDTLTEILMAENKNMDLTISINHLPVTRASKSIIVLQKVAPTN